MLEYNPCVSLSPHAVGLLGTTTDGLGGVHEERLIGPCEQVDQRCDAAGLADDRSVRGILGHLSECSDNVDEDLH